VGEVLKEIENTLKELPEEKQKEVLEIARFLKWRYDLKERSKELIKRISEPNIWFAAHPDKPLKLARAMSSSWYLQHVARIVELLKSDEDILQIWLFGSLAREGEYPREQTDIDLLIVKETSKKPVERSVETEKMLSSLEGLPPTDVVVLTPEEFARKLGEEDSFLTRIVEEGILLFTR